MSLDWRMLVAHFATQVFTGSRRHPTVLEAMPELPGVAEGTRETSQPTITDLVEYLKRRSMPGVDAHVMDILLLVDRMRQVGMLYDWGRVAPSQGPLGHTYWTMQLGTPLQTEGDLWQSRLFGAELIIPSYGAVTIQIPGVPHEGVLDAMGSGLVLDETHILTNAHVVNDMDLLNRFDRPTMAPPGRWMWESAQVELVEVYPHAAIDVAVVEVKNTVSRLHPTDKLIDGAVFCETIPEHLKALPDIVFREPRWSDDTYVFGYPHIPTARERALVVQNGEVVNPRITDYFGQNYFLFSATARPGNSGGPVVAGDGHVIGIVANEVPTDPANSAGSQCPLTEATQQHQGSAASFYRGVPASAIVQALTDLGFRDLIKVDPEDAPAHKQTDRS